MSKDKGTKNHKKAPADKSAGKAKVISSYKSEGKSGIEKSPAIEAFIPKGDSKPGSGKKS